MPELESCGTELELHKEKHITLLHHHHHHRHHHTKETAKKHGKKSSRRSKSPTVRSEEPTTTREDDSPSRGGVETVDRGVGPTPLPPPPGPVDPTHPAHRIPPFYGIPPYPDPRNGLVDPHMGYAFGYPHPYAAINTPIPVNTHTHEGRYQWPPPPMALHTHQAHGLSSPYSDVSPLSLGGRRLSGSDAISTDLAARLHWEHYRRMFPSPLSHRAFSPSSLASIPGLLPHPPRSHLSSIFGDTPATPGSGSITLPGSIESSRLTSPRPSLLGKGGRKRALSHSPFSEYGYLDIESLTRSSEGSLQLTPFAHNSRSSSAASGSYGHLSAATLGAVSPAMAQHPLLRHGSLSASPFLMHQTMVHPSMLSRQPMPGPPMMPHIHHPGMGQPHAKLEHQMPSTTTKEPGSSVVSSTVDHGDMDPKRTKIKKEYDILDSPGDSKSSPEGMKTVSESGRHPIEGEPDFIETNCHWRECHKEYETQDELVRHINQDHIQTNKKAFVCRWEECSREEKPFKAQYMLVVHMRRHTGEKPHRCTFEGCNKAYSRLENLKTHLRSHTGEKPYMCEFPGCTKAFSNASDRAKHQNRTHSNAKPYVCKAPGCTKRYTDPSSLRKHVKTVHGPDFYANKKHKGNERRGEDDDQDHGDDDDDDQKMGERLSQPVMGGPADHQDRDSRDSFGSKVKTEMRAPPSESSMEQSPASTHSHHSHHSSDITDYDDHSHHGGAPAQLAVSIGGAVDADDEDDEPDEVVLPATTVSANTVNTIRSGRGPSAGRMRGRIQAKNALPPLPTGNNRHSGTTITELSPKPTRTHHRRFTDLMSQNSQDMPVSLLSRRDSNTSTLSSAYQSGRSEASPYHFNSRFSSGRSSENNSRLSIANSPYEYDISGNVPNSHSRRLSSCSDFSSGVSNIAHHMENTRLGSQSSINLPPLPASRGSLDRSQRYARRDSRDCHSDGWQSSTPARTPLPHEIPNRDVRRASDPTRVGDPNLSGLRRFHSLNQVKPLPLPESMKSLAQQRKDGSNQNMNSSRESIATDIDPSLAEDTDIGSQIFDSTVDEEALERSLLEDNDDMLIPDEMRRFLTEQQYHVRNPADSTVPDRSPQHPGMESRSPRQPMMPHPSSAPPRPGPSHTPMSQSSTSQHNQPQRQQPNVQYNQPCSNMNCTQQSRNPAMVQQWQQSSQMHPNKNSSQCYSCQQMYPDGRQSGGYPVQNSMNNVPSMSSTPLPMATPSPNMFQQPQYGPHPQQAYMHQGHMGQQQQMGVPPNMAQQQGAMMQQHYGSMPNMHMAQMSPAPPQNMGYGNNQWQQMSGMSTSHPGPLSQQYPQQYYNNMPSQQPQSLPGSMMPSQPKQERQSPLIQVPQVSQSKIPARKVNRQSYRQEYVAQCLQADCYSQPPPTPNLPQQQQQQQQMYNMQQMQQNMMNQGASGSGYQQPGMMGNPHQQQQQQQLNASMVMPPPALPPQMGYNPQQQTTGAMGGRPMERPSCQHQGMSMQMSPNCNQVSSTTDAKSSQTDFVEPGLNESIATNLNSISTDNLIDNLSGISMESLGGGNVMMSPTALLNRTSSQSSRLTTPYMEGKASAASGSIMDTSNMVVNDMSSMLSQLAEENRYLSGLR